MVWLRVWVRVWVGEWLGYEYNDRKIPKKNKRGNDSSNN